MTVQRGILSTSQRDYFEGESMDESKDMLKAARIFAESVITLANISGMNAENKAREILGHSIAYHEDSFSIEANKLFNSEIEIRMGIK